MVRTGGRISGSEKQSVSLYFKGCLRFPFAARVGEWHFLVVLIAVLTFIFQGLRELYECVGILRPAFYGFDCTDTLIELAFGVLRSSNCHRGFNGIL